MAQKKNEAPENQEGERGVNKYVGYALGILAIAIMLNVAASLLREVWWILTIVGLIALAAVIYIRVRKNNRRY